MTNPTLLFWDSDALIQFLLTNVVSPLRALRTNYGIQSVIVPEVEIELLSSRRFAHLVPSLRKATGNRLIEVLDEPTYFRLLGASEALRADAVGTSYGDIQALGRRYNQRIDTGESYTYAAALTLHQPACSNDWSAIKTLLFASLPLPFSVQRAYDVLVFAHQIGLMPERECDRFKKTLVQQGEFVPAQQQSKSFREGLAVFEPRLIDSTQQVVGIPPRREGPKRFSSPLFISPTAGATL